MEPQYVFGKDQNVFVEHIKNKYQKLASMAWSDL